MDERNHSAQATSTLMPVVKSTQTLLELHSEQYKRTKYLKSMSQDDLGE